VAFLKSSAPFDDYLSTPSLGIAPEVVKAVKAQNALGASLADVYYSEIFVTDKLGANVAMTAKTSDYWQGDELKFTESWKAGAGGVFVSDVGFDKSSQTYVVHVSVPVKDRGVTIGVLVAGINVEKAR
jgi:hypothetical protein